MRIYEFPQRELLGFFAVAFTLVVWARAPTEPNMVYTSLMVASGFCAGVIIILGLVSVTHDPTEGRPEP